LERINDLVPQGGKEPRWMGRAGRIALLLNSFSLAIEPRKKDEE
jgi:hypothetical protein